VVPSGAVPQGGAQLIRVRSGRCTDANILSALANTYGWESGLSNLPVTSRLSLTYPACLPKHSQVLVDSQCGHSVPSPVRPVVMLLCHACQHSNVPGCVLQDPYGTLFVSIPSLLDPSLCPSGTHTFHAFT
jgi:hypothetical protein